MDWPGSANPASYELPALRGGRSLAGVFAVRTGPGLIIVIMMTGWLYRRVRRRPSPG